MNSKIVLIGLVWLFASTPLFAAETCMQEEDAKKIVVELEKGELCSQQVILHKESAKELENQLKLKDAVIDVQKKQIADSERLSQTFKEVNAEQIKSCKTLVEGAKPSVWKTMLEYLGFFGTGILVGVIFL